MTNKQAKSNLEKLARSKRKLRIVDFLSMDSANTVLDKVAELENLKGVIVLAQTPDGTQIFHSWRDSRMVIFYLDMMHTQMRDAFLYPVGDDPDDDMEEVIV